MGKPHPTGDLVTTITPSITEEGDARFGPVVVRGLNYESDDGTNHIVIAIGAHEPGDYRIVFEGDISDVTKSTPTGEVVEGYLHYRGEWPV
jgi:hypothetical protein